MSNKSNNNGVNCKMVWVAAVGLVLVAAIVIWAASGGGTGPDTPDTTAPGPTDQMTLSVDMVDMDHDLGNGMKIINAGAYTGIFMEDGTDDIVTGILMLVVENTGTNAVQYAEITLPTENGDARFTLSTLPAGESVVLLEQNRMSCTGKEDVSAAWAANVAVFSEPLRTHEDKLKLQIMDGAINVTNISGEDIAGDVVLYYKNASSDLLYGGITYRVRIEGGIKTDEIKQITGGHFSGDGSRIMFVTVG